MWYMSGLSVKMNNDCIKFFIALRGFLYLSSRNTSPTIILQGKHANPAVFWVRVQGMAILPQYFWLWEDVLTPAALCFTTRSPLFGNWLYSDIKCLTSYWKRPLVSVGKAMMGWGARGKRGCFWKKDTGSLTRNVVWKVSSCQHLQPGLHPEAEKRGSRLSWSWEPKVWKRGRVESSWKHSRTSLEDGRNCRPRSLTLRAQWTWPQLIICFSVKIRKKN